MSESLSTSVESPKTTDRAVFLVAPIDCATATGASFTGMMLMATVAATESLFPSFTLKVNESLPLAFAVGV